MKFFLSLPTDTAFFRVYARFASGIKVSTYFAQIISALTEFGVLYGLLYNILSFFFVGNWTTTAALLGAVVAVFLIEIGLRFFLPHAVDAFLYGRFSGLYLLMSVFILVMTAALLFASGALSFRGSKSLVDRAAPPPVLQSTTIVDADYQKDTTYLLEQYRADTATTSRTYAALGKGVTTSYHSKVNIQKDKYSSYERREERTGNSYGTRKSAVRAKINELVAARDAELSELTKERARELRTLRAVKNRSLDSLRNIHTIATTKITTGNDATTAAATATTTAYGDGLGWLTIIFLAYLVVCIILERVYRKGAGIEEIPIPTDYYFRESILSEWKNAASERVNQYLRQRIADFTNATPPPPLPSSPHALLNIVGLEQPQYLLSIGNSASGQRVQLPHKLAKLDQVTPLAVTDVEILEEKITTYMESVAALEEKNLHEQARELELKAEDVIKTYLERNGERVTAQMITDLKGKVSEYVNDNSNPNPFLTERRKIGFTTRTDPTATDAATDATNTPYAMRITDKKKDKVKDCQHCGKSYQYRTTWQKYCSEECRQKAWEQRTGKALKKKKKK